VDLVFWKRAGRCHAVAGLFERAVVRDSCNSYPSLDSAQNKPQQLSDQFIVEDTFMAKRLLLICLSLVVFSNNSFAQHIPSNVKEIVTFIYTEMQKPQDKQLLERLSRLCEDVNLERPVFPCPAGTGFFVGVPDSTNPAVSYVYLVTAKHVLFDSKANSLYPKIITRLNKRGGSVLRGEIPLVAQGSDRTVYFHSDPTVDLAVIPTGWPTSDIIEGKWFPEKLISDKARLKSLHIEEGTEVFFTGLFTQHIGTKRNYPIFRFGHLALVTDEKISWGGGQMAELFLMESSSYGGNSGSPVFFLLDLTRPPEDLRDGPLHLAGVMSGAFQDIKKANAIIEKSEASEGTLVEQAARQTIEMSFATNIGIAGVVPSYKLLEILHSEELEQRRRVSSSQK
jgi:hypothetical protein